MSGKQNAHPQADKHSFLKLKYQALLITPKSNDMIAITSRM
jgi:hypothetical protein